jgi:hypothetical protein
VNKIATYKFELPADRPAQQPVKVTYSYDVNQRMNCRFEDVESGRKLEVDFEVGSDGTLAKGNPETQKPNKQAAVAE